MIFFLHLHLQVVRWSKRPLTTLPGHWAQPLAQCLRLRRGRTLPCPARLPCTSAQVLIVGGHPKGMKYTGKFGFDPPTPHPLAPAAPHSCTRAAAPVARATYACPLPPGTMPQPLPPHRYPIVSDLTIADLDLSIVDALILPGGCAHPSAGPFCPSRACCPALPPFGLRNPLLFECGASVGEQGSHRCPLPNSHYACPSLCPCGRPRVLPGLHAAQPAHAQRDRRARQAEGPHCRHLPRPVDVLLGPHRRRPAPHRRPQGRIPNLST